jgi:SOS-response transcriptional repressor LexA
VQCQTTDDPEDGGRYTVKRYASQRRVDEEGNQHTQIELQPLNPVYRTIHLDAATAVDLRIIGEYLTLVPTP